MSQPTTITKRIENNENKYGSKALIGLMDVSSEEYSWYEKNAKQAVIDYQYHSLVDKEKSEILSIYSILFYVFSFEGDKFWESLGKYFQVEENTVRDASIAAIKKTYGNRKWNFYQTTRNEYVETIKMHGVIGKDSSGDRIIYALYLIYLKDFERTVTNEKLDFFFPYLRNIFRMYEGQNESEKNEFRLNGIAYVRNQFPKSFVHAYLLNPSAVAKELKSIFHYFEYMEGSIEQPIKIKKRMENKINQSFKDNNNFINEYTKPHRHKKKLKDKSKQIIQYGKKATILHIPMHFIDFAVHEEKTLILKVFNSQKLLHTEKLKVTEGGISWKSKPIDLQLSPKLKNIRYQIEKEKQEESIYDSGESLYARNQELIKLVQHEKRRSKEINLVKAPKIFHVESSQEKEEVSLDNLQTGYVYEIVPADSVEILHSEFVKDQDRLLVVLNHRSKVITEQKIYQAKTKDKVSYLTKKSVVPHVWIKSDNHYAYVIRKAVQIGIIMKFPYSLNELELKVNDVCYTGQHVRKSLLKEVRLLENGDFLYQIELIDELSKQQINNLSLFIKINDLEVPLATYTLYYDPEWKLTPRFVEIDNKKYLQLCNVVDLRVESIGKKDTDHLFKFQLFQDTKELEVLINTKQLVLESEIFPYTELENSLFYDFTEENLLSLSVIKDYAYQKWFLQIKEFIIELIFETNVQVFLTNLMEDFSNMQETMMQCLEKVDSNFLNQILTGLTQTVSGEGKIITEYQSYIADLLTLLAEYEQNSFTKILRLKANEIYKLLKPKNVNYQDPNISVSFSIDHSKLSTPKGENEILNSMTVEKQERSFLLYELASSVRFNEQYIAREIRNSQKELIDEEFKLYFKTTMGIRSLLLKKILLEDVPQWELFMDLFYQFAIDYNREIVCEMMNVVEEAAGRSLDINARQVSRRRLLFLAKALKLNISRDSITLPEDNDSQLNAMNFNSFLPK